MAVQSSSSAVRNLGCIILLKVCSYILFISLQGKSHCDPISLLPGPDGKLTCMFVCLWEETGVARENLHKHEENVQTLHRKTLGLNWWFNPEPYCETSVLTTELLHLCCTPAVCVYIYIQRTS